MKRQLLPVLLSVILLSAGWLGVTGLGLLVALVPLLYISAEAEPTRRGWWRTFGWATLTFVGWNVATVWWIWNATPVGPIAATIVSSALNLFAFMLYHTILKRGPKPLAYTVLVAAWVATEYWYLEGEVSWPWLLLGNGFSH
ncbi:MAG: apolipoprotein N-acyltransferase, partial [Alistipes sp.]|nr:apolipoprotein N-acyltransferase [Alistipes sp.]